jgi:3-hydroxyacyl-[acyl-carrier-protein] dehydratase
MMHCPLKIAADHPSFAGHFPSFPLLPGAILLNEVLQAIQRERGIDLTQWQISSAKFLDVVRPCDIILLEHDAPAAGLIRFAVRVANRTVASGMLSKAQRN